MEKNQVLIWLYLSVFVVMVTAADRRNDNYKAPSVINVGLLQPLEGELGFDRTGSAASMAVRDAQLRGYLNETDVKYLLCLLFYLYGLVICQKKRLFSQLISRTYFGGEKFDCIHRIVQKIPILMV